MARAPSPGKRGRTVGFYIMPEHEKLVARIARRQRPTMSASQAVGLCIEREARRQKVITDDLRPTPDH